MVFGLKFDFQICVNWKPAKPVATLIDFSAGFIGKLVSFRFGGPRCFDKKLQILKNQNWLANQFFCHF
jgi:hypothetical protein